MWKRSTLFTVILLFASFIATGTANSQKQKLGLSSLINRALESNPELEWAQQSLEGLRASRTEPGWWDAPEVRIGYGRDTVVADPLRSRTHPDNQYEASIRLFPKNPLERKALDKLQDVNIELQEVARRDAHGQILQRVHQLYWKASGIDAELELRREIKKLYKEKSAGLQLLLDQGQISLAQSLPNRMKQFELSTDLETLSTQRDEAVEDLAALCGVEPEAILLQAPPKLSEASFALPFGTWKQLAPKSRTDLNQYALQIEEAKVARELVEADRMIWIDHLQTSYEVSNAPGDRDRASLQIALRLPFLVSDQGEKVRAIKNLQAYRAQDQLQRQLVNREVEGLIKTFRSLHSRWQVQAASISAIDQELASAISKMEKQGATLDAASLEAQIARVELKLKSLQLRNDYQQLRLKAGAILQFDDILPRSTD